MPISAFLNDIPKPAWIAAMVLSFIFFWPLGLAILAFLYGSGRIGGRRYANAPGQWYNTMAPGQDAPQQNGCGWGRWRRWVQDAPDGQTQGGWQRRPAPPPSGNRAFDEYRTETLRRLEEEQREFVDYLERLRQAKDKAEFDQFMADRRRPMVPPEAPAAS